MKVIGFRRVDFAGTDGKQITGYSVFCAFPIRSDSGAGMGVDKIFLSDRKLAECQYMPSLDDEVNVSYNRFGKVDSVALVNR